MEDPSPDKTEIINPPANMCPTCGGEIVRTPGMRGRLPKYHPECRPARKSASASPRTVRVSKEEEKAAAQTEQVIEQAARGLRKAVLLLAMVDPYDAFVVYVNAPEILDNLRPVVFQYEWLRRTAVGAAAGGSLIGLAVAIASVALPIAAHHKLIPSKAVAQFLVQLPIFVQNMQEKEAMAENGDFGRTLLGLISQRNKMQQEEAMRRKTADDNGGIGSDV